MDKGCDKIESITYFEIVKCDKNTCLITWTQKGRGTGTAIIRKKR